MISVALGDPYITVDDLQSSLRIEDSVDTREIERACGAASRWVTGYTGKNFNLADTATPRLFHATDKGSVRIDPVGDLTGLAIATDTGQDGTYETAWATTDYQLEPLNAVAYGVPFTHIRAVGNYLYPYGLDRPAVQVTARWGWPSVPDDVKQATLILAARFFKRRDSPDGILGGFDIGPVRVGTRLDPDVEHLLSAYRDIVIA